MYWTFISRHTTYEPNLSHDLENISYEKNFNVDGDANADSDAGGSA